MLGVNDHLPWSLFPSPGLNTTTTIYARPAPDGNDDTGDGTLAKPFQTFARAILAVPRVIEAGFRFIVDITGLGTEVLPVDWAMPPIVNVGDLLELRIPDQSFLFAAPLTIRAYPKLALAPADAQVSAKDAAVVAKVGPGLCKVTIGAARPAWAGGALKGKQLVRNPASFNAACCIFDSTPTELFLCNTPEALNNGVVGPLGLGPDETLDIVEPSAKLMAPPSQRPKRHGNSMVFAIRGNLNFQGIAVACTDANVGNGGLAIVGASQPFLELCNVNELDLFGGGEVQAGLFSTTCSGYVSTLLAQMTPFRSYWNAVGSSYKKEVIGGVIGQIASLNNQWRQTVFEACNPIAPPFGLAGPGVCAGMAFQNCWFRGSQGAAVSLVSPTRLDMTACQIDGSAGDAIRMTGPSQAVLSGVTGSGNAGHGVVTDDGAHVQVKAGVTIGNTDGRAYRNGAAAPVAAWPGAAFNDADAVTFSRVFMAT